MPPGATESRSSQFREFKGVRQEPRGRRRWFEGSGIELVVWFDDSGTLTGFQLLYDARALTWRPSMGFSHSRVDSGPSLGQKQTPLLLPAGDVPWSDVEDLFQRNADSLEPDLREFILHQLARRR